MLNRTSEFNFIFSNAPRYRITRHVLFWATWVAFFTLIYGSRPGGVKTNTELYYVKSYVSAFVESIIFLPDHMLLSYVLMYFILPHYLFRSKYLHSVVSLVVLILFIQITSHFMASFVASSFRLWYGLPAPSTSFYHSTLAGLRGGLTIGGFAAAVKMMKHYYLKQQAVHQLIQEKLTAELQLLKSQVHPHFLFNTLNSLFSLTLSKSDEAPGVVLKLSGLLSYMLYECNTPQVPLLKELRVLNSYIDLEKARYGDRVDVMINFSGDLDGKQIAPLLLLPFVENSFKHGAAEQIDQAWISMDLTVKENILKFKLINSKPLDTQAASQSDERKERIGLSNVKKRLGLIYPDQHELKILNEPETFMVSLTLQLDGKLLGQTNQAVPNPQSAEIRHSTEMVRNEPV